MNILYYKNLNYTPLYHNLLFFNRDIQNFLKLYDEQLLKEKLTKAVNIIKAKSKKSLKNLSTQKQTHDVTLADLESGKNLTQPLNIDTEYWDLIKEAYFKGELDEITPIEINGKTVYFPVCKDYGRRQPLTTQISNLDGSKKIIFDSPVFAENCRKAGLINRHKVAKSGFHPVDFFKELNPSWDIKLINIKQKKSECEKDSEIRKLPSFKFKLYAHFALAELLMIADGEFRENILELCLSVKKEMAEMKKRLRLINKIQGGIGIESVKMPWILKITVNGKVYRYWVEIEIVDTCALHGVASLNDLAEVSGVPLMFKSLMDNYKEKMIVGYFEKPDDFDNYSLGDLVIFEILEANAKNFKLIYKQLGLEDYYQRPKLTIGATVRDLFVSRILKEFGVLSWESKLIENEKLYLIYLNKNKEIDKLDNEKKEKLLKKIKNKKTVDVILELFFQSANCSELKKLITDNRCLNSKVFGGRCRNNKALHSVLKTILVDLDVMGMYGLGQASLTLPIGTPIIEGSGYDFESPDNKYLTLRQWLKKTASQLIYGLWQAIVSTKKLADGSYAELKYIQDFIASWFEYKIKNNELEDLEKSGSEDYINVKTGTAKILKNQVINGIITHDFLHWLYNVCSPQQRNELLDNLYIQTAIYYPLSERLNSLDELLEASVNHINFNTSSTKKTKNGYQTSTKKCCCNAWYGINLGEFIIWDLLALRSYEPKKIIVNGKETKNPFNTLYKLIINTLYGIAVSPFFKSSNVVLGNNITARGRAFIWYAEKGLNLAQSITDGGILELLKVLYPRNNRPLQAHIITDVYKMNNTELHNNHLKLAPLGNTKSIELYWEYIEELDTKTNCLIDIYTPCLIIDGIEYKGKKAEQWINTKCLEHLRQIFPYSEITVLFGNSYELISYPDEKRYELKAKIGLGLYEFEMKDFFDIGVIHGSANYLLSNPKNDIVSFRSYEKSKQHYEFNIENEEIETNNYNNCDNETPAKFFLEEILKNPKKVKRQKAFIKSGILKINDFRNNSQKYLNMRLNPGDTMLKSGLLRELSPSQFTYKTLEQYKKILSEYQNNKNKYGQSWEGFFTNSDNTLNYEKMLSEIDIAIDKGVLSLNNYFDKNRNRHRNENLQHPDNEKLAIIREVLNGKKHLNLKTNVPFQTFTNDEQIEDLMEDNVYMDDDFEL